jgi:Domain of unknown function (DUF222)
VPVESMPGRPNGGQDDPGSPSATSAAGSGTSAAGSDTSADGSGVLAGGCGVSEEWVPWEQVPPEEEFCWADIPDPETGRPAELAGLTEEDLEALTTPVAPAPVRWPDGIVPPNGFLSPPVTTGGPGFGFGEGEPLDTATPGAVLAALAEDAHIVLDQIDDDCLIGLIRTWRRLASWVQAREIAAVTELARRCPADGLPGSGHEYVADELAAALTLTVRTAQGERDLAWALSTVLPATLNALEQGRIDLPRAKVIAAGTSELTPAHAAAVEAAVLPNAPGLTTGQLRAAVARAVLAADPDAATRQREAAQARAYVSCWTGQSGSGHLEGHDLPSAQTLAADARISQIAAAWKAQGALGGLDLLRAHAYLALLLGHDITSPPVSLLPPGRPDVPAAGPQIPAGLRRGGTAPEVTPGPALPPLAGVINLTVPLSTLVGLSQAPGEVTGTGPVDPATARELVWSTAGHPGTCWQLTVTAPSGRAVAHGTSRHQRVPSTGWSVTLAAEPIAAGSCDHRHKESGYRPSPALQRLIRARNVTCCFPGCRRPARRCDLDHVIAFDDGGPTCECNLAPLCRRHHRLKQAEGWLLTQPSPGVLVWLTPAGRRYTTMPSQHPT